MTRPVRVVWQPHLDYLRCVVHTSAAEGRWQVREDEGGRVTLWRPGWRAVERKLRSGQSVFLCDAERGARVWPQPWAETGHITRLDIACDVTGVRFVAEDRMLFTCRGRRRLEERGHVAETIYLGSRESPLMLRIYNKTKHCTPSDREVWRRNGWNGRDAVWRIEYEFHRKAIPEGIELPAAVPALWADALARIRMCTVVPTKCAEQNKAPTHELWLQLGAERTSAGRRAVRLTRRASPPPRTDMTAKQAVDELSRLAERAGVGLYGVLVAHLRKLQRNLT